jgi:hypothetical protein
MAAAPMQLSLSTMISHAQGFTAQGCMQWCARCQAKSAGTNLSRVLHCAETAAMLVHQRSSVVQLLAPVVGDKRMRHTLELANSTG